MALSSESSTTSLNHLSPATDEAISRLEKLLIHLMASASSALMSSWIQLSATRDRPVARSSFVM